MTEEAKPLTPQHFNILSLDGGGVRGALEAAILVRLEKLFPNLLRDLDLIAGVSTGGIQALALAAGATPQQIKDFYETKAKKIFSDSILDDVRDLWRAAGADYNTDNLREVLSDLFGDITMAELNKKVAIVAFDLDNADKKPELRTWKPKIFHNFESRDADLDMKVIDVALASAAAPIYFPAYKGFIDGGVVANNPAMIAIAQALDPRGPKKELKDISLLSFGTGKLNHFVEGENLDWGLMDWGPYLLKILMEGGADLVHFQAKQILKDKYYRVNPRLPQTIGLDDWKKVPELVALAEQEDLIPLRIWLEDHWK